MRRQHSLVDYVRLLHGDEVDPRTQTRGCGSSVFVCIVGLFACFSLSTPPVFPTHTPGETQVEILDMYEHVKQGGYSKEAS